MEITVCLLQTMISKYEQFTAGFFDVVVVDESHRSIYGAWQSTLVHFGAFHIGLTATPASYIDRNTYRFYHCRDFKPDFADVGLLPAQKAKERLEEFNPAKPSVFEREATVDFSGTRR